MGHALAAGEPDDVDWLLGALYPFLNSHGHAREAYEWTELTWRNATGFPHVRGGGTVRRRRDRRFVGELDPALELKEELSRYDGDLERPNWHVATLADLSEVALDEGDSDQARAYADESAAAGGGQRRRSSRRAALRGAGPAGPS